jgi:hypothetical protein
MTPADNAPATPTTPPARVSVWEDFIDIFYAPAQVFRRRAGGSYMIPLLVVSLLVGVLTFTNRGVLQPIYDAEIDQRLAAMKGNPRATPEAIEQGRKMGETIAVVSSAIGTPIIILVFALVVWLFSRIFGAKVTGIGAMVIAAYSGVPFVVENLSWAVQGLLMDPSRLTSRSSISLGAGRLVSPDSVSPVAAAALGHLDVFSIWTAALLAIGIVTLGNAPRSKAVVIGLAIWLVGLLPALLGALSATA